MEEMCRKGMTERSGPPRDEVEILKDYVLLQQLTTVVCGYSLR